MLSFPATDSSFVYALAFGGNGGTEPGPVNLAIAKEVRRLCVGTVIFTEPELAMAFAETFGSLGLAQHVVPDGEKRRRFLTDGEVSAFAAWFASVDAEATRLVIIGDPSTGPVEPKEYKGSGWVAAQVAQLADAVGLDKASIVGQSSHLKDYARDVVSKELAHRGISVAFDSSLANSKDILHIWDLESSQEWVRNQQSWDKRLPTVRLAIEADWIERHGSNALADDKSSGKGPLT